MATFINYLLESFLCLSVFYSFYLVLLRNEKTFQFNRYYLLITPFLSLILPLFNIPIFRPVDPTPVDLLFELPILVTEVTKVVEPQTVTPSWVYPVITIYSVGVLLFALRFLFRIGQLKSLKKNAKEIRYNDDLELVFTGKKHPVFAFGSAVFISDENVESKDLKRILNHEEAHVLQKHTQDILLFEAMFCIMWFNPLMLFIKGDIKQNHEFLADQHATRSDNKLEYVLTMLRQISKTDYNSLAQHFSLNHTKKRIKMIREDKLPSKWIPLSVIPFLVFMVFIFSCTDQFDIEETVITYEDYQEAPDDFAGILLDLRSKYPDKRFYFNLTNDIDLSLAKDSKSSEYEIIHYAQIEVIEDLEFFKNMSIETLDPTASRYYGLIVEFKERSGRVSLDHEELNTKIYKSNEVDVLPTPWFDMNQINYMVKSNFERPDMEGAQDIHGTIKLTFVVNMFGSVIYTKPVSGLDNIDEDVKLRLYGAGVNAVTSTSDYWKPGEKNGQKVSVLQEIEIDI